MRGYLDAAREIKEKFGVTGSVDVGMILGLRDVFKPSCQGEGGKDLESPLLFEAVEKALSELVVMRKKEGEALRADIEARLASMEYRVSEIGEEGA